MQDIPLGPLAVSSSRRKFLQPGFFVKRHLLSVDPTKAEGLIEGFRIGHGCDLRIFRVDAQQDAVRLIMVLRKPSPKFTRRCEAHGSHRSELVWWIEVPIIWPFARLGTSNPKSTLESWISSRLLKNSGRGG